MVQDTDGKPLDGAGVWCLQRTEAGYRRLERKELKRTLTKDDGTFGFLWRPSPGGNCSLQIVAWKVGFCRKGAYVRYKGAGFSAPTGNQTFTLRLAPPATLAGQVVDEFGKGLKGVRVVPLSEARFPESLDFLCARTDAQGRFVIQNIPRGKGVSWLVLSGPGRAKLLAEGLFTPGQKGIRLALPRESRIVGRVVESATGKPVAGIPLRVRAGLSILGDQLAVSDKDGYYVIGGLNEGQYTVAIFDKGPVSIASVSKSSSVRLKQGQTASDVKVELFPAGVIDALITDQGTGRALRGVMLHIVCPNRGAIWRSTDSDGTARISVWPGKYGIFASKHGYKTPNATGRAPLMLGGTDEHLVNVDVQGGRTVKVKGSMIPLPTARVANSHPE